MTIFGREPAAIIAAVQSLLVLALSLGWLQPLGLSTQDDVMAVVGVLYAAGAVAAAYYTSETLLAPLIELFKAGAAVFAIYGFALSTETTGAIIAAITMVLGLVQRTQASPLLKGTFKSGAWNVTTLLEPTPVAPAPVTVEAGVDVDPDRA